MATKGPVNKRKAPTELDTNLTKKLFGRNLSDSDDSDIEEPTVGVVTNVEVGSDEGAPQALWHDDDDEEGEVEVNTKYRKSLRRQDDKDVQTVSTKEYTKRLREAFVRTKSMGKQPSWVKGKKTGDSDSDSDAEEIVRELTTTAMTYVEKDGRMCKGLSKARLLKDITMGHSDKTALSVVKFHRGRPLLVTGGRSSKLRMFTVDSEAKADHFVRSVKFDKFPIKSLDFVEGGNAIVMGSQSQEYLIKCDLETSEYKQLRLPKSVPRQNAGLFAVSRDSNLLAVAGKRGQVYILALKTMEEVRTFSVPDAVVSLQFAPLCQDEIWIMTEIGAVHIFRVGGHSDASHSFIDDGAVRGTKLALSRDGAYLATGSNTGIVNVYQSSVVRDSATPRPLYTVRNIVTACSAIAFSHDAQMMAAGSDVKMNSLRAMHVPTGTMMTDLPARFEKVQGVTSIDFSPQSGYMAVGTTNGATRLYEIQHFKEY